MPNRDSPDSPDAAFAAVGNETRIQILQVLGAEEPLTFSELYGRIDVADSGNFTYHLDKLVGHFVRKSDDEYRLREPGNRIIQAVLSGVVTDTPILESSRLDASCPYCGLGIGLEYREERVILRCQNCVGTYHGSQTDARHLEAHPPGTVAVLRLPPAGLRKESPQDLLDTALAWTLFEFQAMMSGICPRCAGGVDWSLQICETHQSGENVCDDCHLRFAMNIAYRCTNCPHHEQTVPAGIHLLLSDPIALEFVSSHGIHPVAQTWDAHAKLVPYHEVVRNTNPLEAEFVYTIAGDELNLTVDESLEVIDVSQQPSPA